MKTIVALLLAAGLLLGASGCGSSPAESSSLPPVEEASVAASPDSSQEEPAPAEEEAPALTLGSLLPLAADQAVSFQVQRYRGDSTVAVATWEGESAAALGAALAAVPVEEGTAPSGEGAEYTVYTITDGDGATCQLREEGGLSLGDGSRYAVSGGLSLPYPQDTQWQEYRIDPVSGAWTPLGGENAQAVSGSSGSFAWPAVTPPAEGTLTMGSALGIRSENALVFQVVEQQLAEHPKATVYLGEDARQITAHFAAMPVILLEEKELNPPTGSGVRDYQISLEGGQRFFISDNGLFLTITQGETVARYQFAGEEGYLPLPYPDGTQWVDCVEDKTVGDGEWISTQSWTFTLEDAAYTDGENANTAQQPDGPYWPNLTRDAAQNLLAYLEEVLSPSQYGGVYSVTRSGSRSPQGITYPGIWAVDQVAVQWAIDCYPFWLTAPYGRVEAIVQPTTCSLAQLQEAKAAVEALDLGDGVKVTVSLQEEDNHLSVLVVDLEQKADLAPLNALVKERNLGEHLSITHQTAINPDT